MLYQHIPVMIKEAMEYLHPMPGEKFIDCTLGGGGYTMKIASLVGKKGKVIGIDLDEMAINNFYQNICRPTAGNIKIFHGNFRYLQKIVQEEEKERKNQNYSGVVFDLGLSSAQLQDRSRGFSFQLDAPLIMKFGSENSEKRRDADIIINQYKEKDLEKIFREYGEEKYANRIARAIIFARRKKAIKTTQELVEIIRIAVPGAYQHQKIHFATKTFQALRIAANEELNNISLALPQAVDLLVPGGRLVIISYHSLEDRIIKNFFRQESKDCLCPPSRPICNCGHKAKIKIITKKPLIPSPEELRANPRARSAKMRVAEKI